MTSGKYDLAGQDDPNDTFFEDHVEVIAVDFGFADAVQVDHLTDEQVDLVAAIFDKADEKKG